MLRYYGRIAGQTNTGHYENGNFDPPASNKEKELSPEQLRAENIRSLARREILMTGATPEVAASMMIGVENKIAKLALEEALPVVAPGAAASPTTAEAAVYSADHSVANGEVVDTRPAPILPTAQIIEGSI